MTSIYPIRVTFTVSFTSGALAGLKVPDSLGFADVNSARSWAAAVAGRNIGGKVYSDLVIEAA